MSKSLDQLPPFSKRDRGVSVSALNSMLEFNKALFNNLSVAAPLEKRSGANGLQISVNAKRLLPPLPDFDAVLAFDSATSEVYWLETTDACPTTTTTTAAPTTTTA